MKIHIRNGRLIDPASKTDKAQDLFVAAGRIVGVGNAPAGFEANSVLDATGCIVCPGLVDLEQHRVAVAIQPHRVHMLGVPGRLALDPVLIAGSGEVRGTPGGQRTGQGLVVHPRDHQHVAGIGFSRHTSDKAGRIEFGSESQTFLNIVAIGLR